MKVILTRTPTIEAWLARFDAWWSGLSRREQLLVGVLGALLLGLVLVFGVIRPLQAARAQALADIRTAETYSVRIRAAGTSGAPARQRSGPPLQVVNDSAIANNVSVRPEAIPGGVRATLNGASYDAVLAWLADIGASSRLRVVRVTLQRGPAPGRVSGTVDFAS